MLVIPRDSFTCLFFHSPWRVGQFNFYCIWLLKKLAPQHIIQSPSVDIHQCMFYVEVLALTYSGLHAVKNSRCNINEKYIVDIVKISGQWSVPLFLKYICIGKIWKKITIRAINAENFGLGPAIWKSSHIRVTCLKSKSFMRNISH